MKITGATLALSKQCIAFCSASHLVTTTSDQGQTSTNVVCGSLLCELFRSEYFVCMAATLVYIHTHSLEDSQYCVWSEVAHASGASVAVQSSISIHVAAPWIQY
jgi:hypothetical protein